MDRAAKEWRAAATRRKSSAVGTFDADVGRAR
jgi:hypothetical protein